VLGLVLEVARAREPVQDLVQEPAQEIQQDQ